MIAASRLARARQALANGNPAVAEQHAAEIPVCCAGARDEYGVSFAMYGAHLRVTASEGRASFDETAEQIARELRQLMVAGHLGAPEDSIQLRLLAAKAKHATSIAGLVATLEEVSVEIAKRNEFGRLAAQWVAQVDLRAIESNRPVFAALGRGPSAAAAALSRTSNGTAVVMLIDSTGLDRWVGQWAASRASGRVEVRRVAGGPPAAGLLELPLFVEAPGVATLVLGQESTNPATERTRRQLFVAAVLFEFCRAFSGAGIRAGARLLLAGSMDGPGRRTAHEQSAKRRTCSPSTSAARPRPLHAGARR